MSGHLRQLARQAAGRNLPGQPRPLVHAMSGSRLQQDPDSIGEELTNERRDPDDEQRTSPVTSRAEPATSHHVPATSAATPSAREQRQTASQVPVTDATSRRHGEYREALPPSVMRQRLDEIEVLLPLEPAVAVRADEAMGARTPEQRAAQRESLAKPERTGDLNDTVTRPSQPEARRAATETQRRGVDHSPPIVAAPAPEVHIHIGRVELTALQAPQPRSVPRSSAKKPLSLEDYLRQRDSRRR